MKLTEAEVALMHYLWQQGKAFMKDLLEAYPDPKPAPTTVATLLKRMANKGFVAYREYGNSREYFPLVSKEAYFSNQMEGLISDFFSNSAGQFASYFTASANLSTSELEDLKKIIDQQLQKKKP